MDLPLVFTRTAAVQAGWAPRDVDAQLRTGRWTALRRGVYAGAALPPSGPERHAAEVAAAVLATGCDAVGSHESAALVHGLPLFSAYDGPPALSRARAARSARPGMTSGSARAQDWVAFADGRAESPLESVGRWRLHEAELPAPELQVVLGDGRGPIGRVDFSWDDVRTVGEADGFGKYLSSSGHPLVAALRAEKAREDALRDAGFEVFRFTCWTKRCDGPPSSSSAPGGPSLAASAAGRPDGGAKPRACQSAPTSGGPGTRNRD